MITNMEDLAGLGIPRSYSFPYSKELEKISKALVNLKMNTANGRTIK